MDQFTTHNLEEWEMAIIKRYPLVFLERNDTLDPTLFHYAENVPVERQVNLRYGFECKQGWSSLIEGLADVATKLVTDLRSRRDDVFIHSCIVKQKFGVLRWQGSYNLPDPYDRLWRMFIEDTAVMSTHICELTGKRGKLRHQKGGKNAWIQCLCNEEAIKQGYDIKTDDE